MEGCRGHVHAEVAGGGGGHAEQTLRYRRIQWSGETQHCRGVRCSDWEVEQGGQVGHLSLVDIHQCWLLIGQFLLSFIVIG